MQGELPDTATVWEQFIRAHQKLLEDNVVDHDGVEIGGFIRADVTKNLLLIVEWETVASDMESTWSTVVLAKPPLTLDARATAVIVCLTEGSANGTVILVIDGLGNGKVLLGAGNVDSNSLVCCWLSLICLIFSSCDFVGEISGRKRLCDFLTGVSLK